MNGRYHENSMSTKKFSWLRHEGWEASREAYQVHGTSRRLVGRAGGSRAEVFAGVDSDVFAVDIQIVGVAAVEPVCPTDRYRIRRALNAVMPYGHESLLR
jgi:hypothetical protein